MNGGVSGSGAAKTGCWMSRCSCAYVVAWRSLVISLIVVNSCVVQLGYVWMYNVSELVVLLVPFWFPFQKRAVLICSVSLSILMLFSSPGMFSSLDTMRSGAVLYCRCLDMTFVYGGLSVTCVVRMCVPDAVSVVRLWRAEMKDVR